jgi:hypothetical protein
MRSLLALPATMIALVACRPKEVTVEYAPGDPHAFSRDERRAIEEVAERTIPEVRRLLPQLPPSIVLRVSTSTSVIPETGENGSNSQPNVVHWQVDASRGEGVVTIARTQLRATLFHELHHVVRAAVFVDRRLRDHVIREGLATAFERDYGGASPPWGTYPAEAPRWTTEILALPDDTPRAPWLFEHPDGRRWIGLRTGTYLVDRAMKTSGKTSADLVQTPTDELITMGLAP